MSKISLKEKILNVFNSEKINEENQIIKSQLAYGYNVLNNIEEIIENAKERGLSPDEVYKGIQRQITIAYNGALSNQFSDVETEKTQSFRETLKNSIKENKSTSKNKM